MMQLTPGQPPIGFGPGLIDLRIREAIFYCWAFIPEQERSLERVEQEIDRIVKRALANLKDDMKNLMREI